MSIGHRYCPLNIEQRYWTLIRIYGVETEIELILARANIFDQPRNLENLCICPSHRAVLGLGLRRTNLKCAIPDVVAPRKIAILLKFKFASGRTDCLENPYAGNNKNMATILACCLLSKQQSPEIRLTPGGKIRLFFLY